MKSYLLSTLALGLMIGTISAADKPELKDDKQKASYAIGLDIGTNMKQAGADLDPALIAKGLADAFAGKPGMTEEESKAALEAFGQQMRAKMMAKQKEASDKALKEGEDFLAANAKKDGVKVTKSGLQYKVIKSGTGKTPKQSDTVRVHYEGKLADKEGTVFDSSIKRGEPIEFQVVGVIPGWTEALQLMKEGDKWQLFIPSKLGYGERGAGDAIPPNAALIFDVELLAIVPAAK